MSETLVKSTCLIHSDRSAVARCPECRCFYCAECITEHDGRLTCAKCLREEESKQGVESQRSVGAVVYPAIQFVVGLLIIWMLFYFTARFLMLIPAPFHDGTVWE